jgi:DNA-binding response OmpR family regulator
LLQGIPVVLLSGAFEPVDEQKAKEVGCDGILAKPFEPQLVIAKVRELLGRMPPADGATRRLRHDRAGPCFARTPARDHPVSRRSFRWDHIARRLLRSA